MASFGIRCTLVEPGPTGTHFGAGLVRPVPMAVYEGPPVGAIRRALAAGVFALSGDPDKMVDAMLAVADDPDPPLRLTLGSTAYRSIRAGLTARRDALEAQAAVALATDVSAPIGR